MKNSFLFSLGIVACLLIASCNSATNSNYKSSTNYKGEISQIVEYTYDGEMERSEELVNVGKLIPKSITKYDITGNKLLDLSTTYSNSENGDLIWLVNADDYVYNEFGDVIKYRQLYFELANSEIIPFIDSLKFDDYTYSLYSENCAYTYTDGKPTRIERTNAMSFHKSETSMIFNESLQNSANEFNPATIIIEREYVNGLCVKESTTEGTDISILYKKYDGDLLISDSLVIGQYNEVYHFKYLDGVLCEKEGNGVTIKYDNQGRQIYYGNDYMESKASIDEKGNEFNVSIYENSGSVFLKMINSIGLDSLYVFVSLGENPNLAKEVVSYFELMKESQMTIEKFEQQMSDYIINDNASVEVKRYEYGPLDDHGNTLKVIMRQKCLNYYPDTFDGSTPKITESYNSFSTETEIQYFSK